jgi:SAM-dependent MidA family methyltransferase
MLAEARDSVEQAHLAGQARRLLMPGEMGEVFKVLAFGRDLEQPLVGFRLQDLRDSL